MWEGVHIHTHTHTYTYTHIHTHIYTYRHFRSRRAKSNGTSIDCSEWLNSRANKWNLTWEFSGEIWIEIKIKWLCFDQFICLYYIRSQSFSTSRCNKTNFLHVGSSPICFLVHKKGDNRKVCQLSWNHIIVCMLKIIWVDRVGQSILLLQELYW